MNGRRGRTYIDGGGQLTVSQKNTQINSAATTGYVQLLPTFTGLVFVNLTLDAASLGTIFYRTSTSTENKYYLMKRCRITNSKKAIWTDPFSRSPPRVGLWNGGNIVALEQVDIDEVNVGGGCTAPVKIGCKMVKHIGDSTHFPAAVPVTCVAHDNVGLGALDFVDPKPAIALGYSGPSGTGDQMGPTFKISGLHGNKAAAVNGIPSNSTRTLNLYVDKQLVTSFTASNTPGSYQTGVGGSNPYTLDDLVDAINTFGQGWSATRINQATTPDLSVAFLAYPVAQTNYAETIFNDGLRADSATSAYWVKAGNDKFMPVSIGVPVGADLHCDYMQPQTNTNSDNVLIMGCFGVQGASQMLYLGTSGTSYVNANIAIILNAFSNDLDQTYAGTFVGQVSAQN